MLAERIRVSQNSSKNHKKDRSVPSKLQAFKMLKKSAKVSYALKYGQKTSKMIKKSEI